MQKRPTEFEDPETLLPFLVTEQLARRTTPSQLPLSYPGETDSPTFTQTSVVQGVIGEARRFQFRRLAFRNPYEAANRAKGKLWQEWAISAYAAEQPEHVVVLPSRSTLLYLQAVTKHPVRRHPMGLDSLHRYPTADAAVVDIQGGDLRVIELVEATYAPYTKPEYFEGKLAGFLGVRGEHLDEFGHARVRFLTPIPDDRRERQPRLSHPRFARFRRMLCTYSQYDLLFDTVAALCPAIQTSMTFQNQSRASKSDDSRRLHRAI